jgi:Tfp pilus assembly protein PilO
MNQLEELFFKLNRVYRFAVVGAVCVIMLVLFYILVVSDMRTKAASLEKSIASTNIEIQNQKQRLARKDDLLRKIEQHRKELEEMVAGLPTKQDIETLLKNITDLLSESRLVASRFVPGGEQINEKLGYAKIPVAMNVGGDYEKLGAFLAKLNALPRIVNVPQIRLSPRSTGKNQNTMASKLGVITLEAAITGETYRRLSEAEKARIEAAAKKKAGGRRRR